MSWLTRILEADISPVFRAPRLALALVLFAGWCVLAFHVGRTFLAARDLAASQEHLRATYERVVAAGGTPEPLPPLPNPYRGPLLGVGLLVSQGLLIWIIAPKPRPIPAQSS